MKVAAFVFSIICCFHSLCGMHTNQNIDSESQLKTLLHNAIAFRNSKRVCEILDFHQIDLELSDTYGDSSLLIAVRLDVRDIISWLLLKKAKIDAINVVNREGVLHIVAGKGTAHILPMLESLDYQRKLPTMINSQDLFMQTPLHKAVLNQHRDIVNWLLYHGADPMISDDKGNSALHIAAITGSADILHSLLERLMKKVLWSELVAWAPNGQGTILVWPKEEVNSRNNEGNTPLHCAALEGHSSVSSALFFYKANPLLKNCAGYTAFELALIHKNQRRTAQSRNISFLPAPNLENHGQETDKADLNESADYSSCSPSEFFTKP